MLSRVVESITSGPIWWLKAWVVSLVAAFAFSCVPAVWMYENPELPPAYELKRQDPLADTSKLTIPEHPGERSHGAKLTPRVFGAWMLHLSAKISNHPYWAATLGGLLFLLAGVLVGKKLTDDRISGLLCGFLFAGLYTSNACFSVNHGPKPFDGIAIGMVALTLLLMDIPWLMGVAAFFACWTDERAIVALVLIGCLIHVRLRHTKGANVMPTLVLVASVAAYVVSRVFMGRLYQWNPSDVSMIGDNLLASFSYAQMAAWTALEGGWMLAAALVLAMSRCEMRGDLVRLVVAGISAIATCIMVLDISRATAFIFPWILGLVAGIRSLEDDPQRMRRLLGFAAVVSLVASNVEIISSIAFTPLPTTTIVVWLGWFA
jgi:tetrahydromethanopterin S-methyltransferase subunit F